MNEFLQRFSNLLNKPEVLTNPQEFLGLHTPKVLEFWNRIENLTQEEWETIQKRSLNFYHKQRYEWLSAADKVINSSIEKIGWKFTWDVTIVTIGVYGDAVCYATLELIGGVENPTFLKMFDNL